MPIRVQSRASLVCSLFCVALGAGCAVEGALDDTDIQENESGIIRGKASTAKQDAVVYMEFGNDHFCTGTLVAPNLVLTARHCVSQSQGMALCTAEGEAEQGGALFFDSTPSDIAVYAGRDQKKGLKLVANGQEIIHDGARNVCNHDIAFVLLDTDVEGITPAALRLSRATKPGETVTAVGWGLTDKQARARVRMQRPGLAVEAVGPAEHLAKNELRLGESVCSGDSGGPLLSAKGAVIGVVSRGGNGQADTATGPADSCMGEDAENVFTQVSAFPALVNKAFAAAGAKPKREP
jgi:V8-like Glu-specific endopeptidase